MNKPEFKGLMAPVFTPFKDDMSINLDIIPNYAKYLNDSGIHAVLVNGTTGEGMSMNTVERKLVTEKWAKVTKENNQHLMVQVGGTSLPDVKELTRHAAKLNVGSILCLPDLYFKPTNIKDLINYLKIVASEAPNIPLFYYHIPAITNVNIHMGQFLNTIKYEISNFKGIKFTSNDLNEGMLAVRANNFGFTIYLGADQLMAGAYALGFDSSIATTLNIFPKLGIKILKSFKDSNFIEGKQTQDILSKFCSIITENGPWVPSMKTAMNLHSPINVGPVRKPLDNLFLSAMNNIKNEIRLN